MDNVFGIVALIAFVAFVVGAVSLVKPTKWARIPSRKAAGIVMGGSFVVFIVSASFLPEDSDPSASAETTTTTVINSSQPSNTTAASGTSASSTTSPASSTTIAPTVLPEYSIVAEEDISFAGATRFSLRVAVEAGTNRAGLRAVGEAIATEYRRTNPYNALNILFYHYPELADDITSLGSWDDAPNGVWSDAAEVELGDYSKHQAIDHTKEKDWSLLPTPRQAHLYRAYLDVLYLIDTIDDDVLIWEAAAAEGTTRPEVEAAIDAFLTWVFNDESR